MRFVELELKRRAGSFRDAPFEKVSFTTFLSDSPVQMMPSCDQIGVPIHFHSSTTSSTAARTPKKPADAEAGAALVRKLAIWLFDRDEREAANWPLIANTLFKAALRPSTGRRMTQAARRSCGGSTRGLMTVWRLILLG